MTFTISTHRHHIITFSRSAPPPTTNPQEQQPQQEQQEECNTSETIYHFSLWDRARKVYRLIVGQVNPATPAST